jgi:hypothetical protein
MAGANAAQESHIPSTVLIGPDDVEFWESVTKEAEKNEPARHNGLGANALTQLSQLRAIFGIFGLIFAVKSFVSIAEL